MGSVPKYLELVDEAYVCCEDFDFLWDAKDVYRFILMWEQGMPITKIAEQFNRRVEEVFLLAMDQANKGYIKYRTGGIWGRRKGD